MTASGTWSRLGLVLDLRALIVGVFTNCRVLTCFGYGYYTLGFVGTQIRQQRCRGFGNWPKLRVGFSAISVRGKVM